MVGMVESQGISRKPGGWVEINTDAVSWSPVTAVKCPDRAVTGCGKRKGP